MGGAETRDFLHPPSWLFENPELRRRGIDALPYTLKPLYVWMTQPRPDSAPWAVKIVRPHTPEIDIYEYLRKNDLSSPNHTLPVEIVQCDEPFLIMPAGDDTLCIRMNWRLCETLDDFYQIVEGIEYLHKHRIAHMDFVLDNTVVALETAVKFHPQLELGKIYIIDFGFACRFELGPGQQPAVDLGHLTLSRRYHIAQLDPFAWDVLCMGETLEQLLTYMYALTGNPPPKICTWYVQWVIGKEKGCTGVCHCRPTARRARQVLSVIRWLAHRWAACARAFERVIGFFPNRRRA